MKNRLDRDGTLHIEDGGNYDQQQLDLLRAELKIKNDRRYWRNFAWCLYAAAFAACACVLLIVGFQLAKQSNIL